MKVLLKKTEYTYVHTYIHNWTLETFSQDYGLHSHTTHVVCVNFIHEWRDLQLNIDSERRNIFMTDLFTLRVFATNLLRGKRQRNIFFHISFRCLARDTNPDFASNKLTHFILQPGNFFTFLINSTGSYKLKFLFQA